MTRDEAINEVTILLAACNSAAQGNPDNAIVNIDRKAQEALQFLSNALYKIDEGKLGDFLKDKCTLTWDIDRGCATLLMDKDEKIGCLNDLVRAITQKLK